MSEPGGNTVAGLRRILAASHHAFRLRSNSKSIPLSLLHPLCFFSTLFLQPLPSPPIFTTIDHVIRDAFVRNPQDAVSKFLQ